MAKIVIKKTIDLDFLGEEYKGSFLTFKAIPIGEFKKLTASVPEDGAKAVELILNVLKDKFVVGKFQGEDVAKEDLDQLDVETTTECFKLLTGQKLDPKELKQ